MWCGGGPDGPPPHRTFSPSKDQVRYRSPATALSGALGVVVEPLAALAAQPTGLDHATE